MNSAKEIFKTVFRIFLSVVMTLSLTMDMLGEKIMERQTNNKNFMLFQRSLLLFQKLHIIISDM